jgi:transcriptional regulator with XRE-family HTH domain
VPRTRSIPPDDPVSPAPIGVLELAELGPLLRERRGALSVRQAAEEAGVSFSTLSRVETGHQPDLATFLRLCAWLGVEPSRFVRPTAARPKTTLDEVTKHLATDPRLGTVAAERIVAVVRDMYAALARDVPTQEPLAMHLRAASVMRPGVPERLAKLLTEMRAALGVPQGS